jgi:nucleoid-associated protein YgaU
MKLLSKISVLLFLVFLTANTFAQEKISKDEWEAQMQSNTAKIESLTKEVSALDSDIAKLRQTSASIPSYEDCIGGLNTIVGATKSDVDNYRKAVNELEGKIRRKEGPKVDRQKDLNALKANKISALPEFYDLVHTDLQALLDAWQEDSVSASKDINYTVVKGDCLWFIAKKKEHYGNGFAWPKIYQANKDQIKNPNLIYPKQILKVPPLTEDEKTKFEKLRKNYKPAPAK